MVLKRKLPSKLTQPNPTAQKDVEQAATAPLQTDFSAPASSASENPTATPAPFSEPEAPAAPAVKATPAPTPISFMMDVPEEDLMPAPATPVTPASSFPEATETTAADPFAPAAVPAPPPAPEAPASPKETQAEPVAEPVAAAPVAPAMAAPQAPQQPNFSQPHQPKSGALTRKKKKGKKPFGEQPQAETKPTASSGLIDAVKKETEEEEILPNMEGETYTTAPTHFDGSDRVETSLKEIRGEFVDPSTQETEAAYISAPAEQGYDSPRITLPDLPLPGTENKPAPKNEPEMPAEASPSQTEKDPQEEQLFQQIAATQAALNAKKETEEPADKELPVKPEAPKPEFSAPEKPTAGWNMDAFVPPAVEEPKGEQPEKSAVGQDFFADVSLEKPVPLAPLPKAGEDAKGEGDIPPPIMPGGGLLGGTPGNGTPKLPQMPSKSFSSSGRTPINTGFKMIVVFAVVLLAGVSYFILSGGSSKEHKLNQTYVSLNQAPTVENELLPPPATLPKGAVQIGEEQAKPTTILAEENTQGSQIEIDFVNEENAMEENVISAQGNEEMPEELGALAKFQRAVLRERAKKEGKQDLQELEAAMEDVQEVDDEAFAAAIPTKDEIQNQLAEYRKALTEANNHAELPKPNEFMDDYVQKHASSTGAGKTGTTSQEEAALAPPVLENPYNLPVIPQPEAEAMAPTVRTLEDFDMAAFEPEEKRVRIPKGVRPRLSAAQFPSVEVLSFVPERGIIATNRGREGVLLIGESIEGWELVGVAQDYAEFNNGTRKHTLVRRN